MIKNHNGVVVSELKNYEGRLPNVEKMANNTYYLIERKFEKRWEYVKREPTLSAAYEYVAKVQSQYQARIIRVVRSVVFKEEK